MMPLIHGQASRIKKMPLYTAWWSMRSRCLKPQHAKWKNYGGRGIRICSRWDSFENFAADMGPHPGKGWSLDRIDNDQGYSKVNCSWATSRMQQRNKRGVKLTEQITSEIRRRYIPYNNCAALAAEYGVAGRQIRRVATGERWA